jgi:hypothetical protein
MKGQMMLTETWRAVRHYIPVILAGLAPLAASMLAARGYILPEMREEVIGAIVAIAGAMGYGASKVRDTRRVRK